MNNMSITSWLKRGQSMKRPRTEGLPDPRDCKDETEATICAAPNDRIDQLIDQTPTKRRKRGEYSVYSDQTRLNIAKSALEIGVNKTARKFSQQLGKKVNESTVRNMKKSYLQHLQKGDHPTLLPKSPRGRPLMLGDIDQRVQTYITNARLNGAAVGIRMVMAAAEGIVTKTARHQLHSYGGHISITKTWAQSLLHRMGYVQRKGTKDVKHVPKDFDKLRDNWLTNINESTNEHSIPDDMILNWDQTGCQLTPGGNWTMEKEGSKQVTIAGSNDKRQITLLLTVTKAGTLLPPQLIYSGKTSKCLPATRFPSDWDPTLTSNHWSNEESMLRYIDNIILPYISRRREELQLPDQKALVVMDYYAAHRTDSLKQKLIDNNIEYHYVPAACTDQLQPLDLSRSV